VVGEWGGFRGKVKEEKNVASPTTLSMAPLYGLGLLRVSWRAFLPLAAQGGSKGERWW